MPSTFRLIRPATVDLVFDGELLADVSSKDDPGQTHWTEIRIYRTDTGKYVGETIGCSALPDQRARITIRVVDSADQVAKTLERSEPVRDEPKKMRTYLTDLALDAITEAAKNDPAVAAAGEERI